MKQKVHRLLGLLLCFVMVMGVMPSTAYASTPGQTEDNPVICTTFDEFKAAMESTTVTYVKLNGASGVMPSRESLGAAISNTTYKVLTIEGTNTFWSPLSGNNDCLIWPKADLMINGTGTLEYQHGNTGGTGAVISMFSEVLLTINGNVTLKGNVNGTAFGRAIFAQAGTTTIKGGSFIGYSALNDDYTDIEAVLIENSAKVTINGGSFSASFYDATGSKKAYGLAITNTATGEIRIKAGTFSQGIDIGATGKTITTCGYFDTAKASITAGGSPVEATASTDVLKNTEVIVTDTSVIGSVAVAVTTPVAGVTPATPSSGTANVTVSNYMWTIQPGGTGISSFEGGKTYRCTVLLNPASGYTFNESGTTVTIGGQTATIDSQSTTGIKAYVNFTTPAVPVSVSSVAISVTAPTAGAAPAAPTTSTANVSIAGYQWKTGGNPLAEGATFEPGKTYRLEMTIYPTTGQSLSTTATATVNGNAATIMDHTESYLNCYYEFTLPEAITINTIAATITPPKAGATPDMNLGLPTGVICTEITWKDMLEEKFMSPTDTYIEGRNYRCDITIKAKPEYIFANPISKVTLNGNDADVWGQTVRYLGFEATFVATAAPVTEYDITVTDGTATIGAGTVISKAAEGTMVTLTANAAPSGKVFDKWVVESGSITLADANSVATTFIMPASAVSVKATYKDHTFTGDWNKDETGHWHVCSVCGEKEALQKHIAGPEATATTPQTCTVCGYVITPAKGDTGNTETNPPAGNTEVKVPEAGTTLTDSDNKAVYKVTGTDTANPTIEYTAPVSNTAKTVTIPATIKLGDITYKVTSVSKNAFKNNKKLTKVTIGSNVITIGASAFSGCTNLTTVTLGKNVKTIGASAFSGCKKLTKITLGNSVATIGASAFSGCSKLKTVTLGKNVTTIGDKAFYKCTSLVKITIPAKVSKIGKQAFYGCKKLKTITIKTTKLTSKKVGKNAFGQNAKKVTVTLPKLKKNKKTAYAKMLKTKGLKKAKFK